MLIPSAASVLVLAALARAEPALAARQWFPAEQLADLRGRIETRHWGSAGPISADAKACPAPVPGKDSEDSEDCAPRDLEAGLLSPKAKDRLPDPGRVVDGDGRGSGETGTPAKGAAAVPAINAGFRALGPANSAGTIDGPGKQGNGKFRVLKNDPYEMSLEVNTGYIAGVVTLKRDPGTGRDSMIFKGRKWSDDKWGEYRETVTDIVVRYDAKKDEGGIYWKEGGEDKSERFWGGGNDGKTMTIEFGGGWDHDFYRD